MEKLRDLFYICTAITGLPFALLLGLFKQYGDGTGNESGLADFWTWASNIGIVIWVVIVGVLIYIAG